MTLDLMSSELQMLPPDIVASKNYTLAIQSVVNSDVANALKKIVYLEVIVDPCKVTN